MKKISSAATIITLLFGVISVSAQEENDASLKSIYISSFGSYEITPSFSSEITNYTINLPACVDFPYTLAPIIVEGTPNNPNALSESFSVCEGLGYTEYNEKLTVKAPDNITTKTYFFKIVRPLCNNADLESILVQGGNITPQFHPDTLEYSVIVYDNLNIGGVSAKSKYYYTEIEKTSRELDESTKEFKLKTTAIDSSVSKTYTIVAHITNGDATLKNLSVFEKNITPVFQPDLPYYFLQVENSVENITIEASPNFEQAFVEGTGKKALVDGMNAFMITVTAKDNIAKKYYTLIVNRPCSESSGGKDSNIDIIDIGSYSFNIYPNPTKGKFHIETENNYQPDVKVFNVSGTLLFHVKSSEIDLSTYPDGMYLLEIEGEQIIKVIKIP